MNRPTAVFRKRRSFSRVAIAALFLTLAVAGIHRLRRHADMSVTPSTYSECEGLEIIAHVKWDMRGTAKGHVFVSAYQIGMSPRTFASGGLVGEVDTGPWVADGTTIILTDESNRKLAKRTVETTDCAANPLWVHPS